MGYFSLLALITFAIGLAHCNQCFDEACNCLGTDFSVQIAKCPDGRVETFVKKDAIANKYTTICCKPGSDGEKEQLLYLGNCEVSQCFPKADLKNTRSQLCLHMRYQYFVTGQKIEFEETIRDNCFPDNDGKVGVFALCCQKNSTDILLTSLLGVENKEFSHFARLPNSGGQCGATVYNKRWLLTASHCVVNETTYQVKTIPNGDSVKINTWISEAYTEDSYSLEQIVVHPNSSRLKPLDSKGRMYNDIALVKLGKDIQFGPNVKALPIPPKGFDPLKYGDRAILVGYGTADTLRLSKKLQKTSALIRDGDALTRPGNIFHFLENWKDQLLFVGGIVGQSVSSVVGKGDSGGPAICKGSDGTAVLCGITSFAAGYSDTCEQNWDEANCHPSAYVQVQYFQDWIESVAGDQSDAELLHQHVGGYKVQNSLHAHQVRLTSNDGKVCGGTLIREDVVLTAAHCVVEDDGVPKSLRVTAATNDLDNAGHISDTFYSTMVIVHPDFGKISGLRRKRLLDVGLKENPNRVVITDNLHTNDLALVKLNGKVNISSAHIPALATNKTPVSGTEFSFLLHKNGSGSLVRRSYKLLSNPDCQTRLDRLSPAGVQATVDDNVVCGVEKYSGGSVCDRELGGGLICKEGDGADVLCGVQMFRLCDFAIPNMFANVAQEANWIKSNLKIL